MAPVRPQDKSFVDLVGVLRAHYAPKPMVIAERFHFHRRNQQSGESIAEYLAQLRRLALHCEFGDYLDQALRDRLVCGMQSESIQRRLLTEADLTLTRAVTLAQGMEAATKNTQSLKIQEAAVQQVSKHMYNWQNKSGKGQPGGNSIRPVMLWVNPVIGVAAVITPLQSVYTGTPNAILVVKQATFLQYVVASQSNLTLRAVRSFPRVIPSIVLSGLVRELRIQMRAMRSYKFMP